MWVVTEKDHLRNITVFFHDHISEHTWLNLVAWLTTTFPSDASLTHVHQIWAIKIAELGEHPHVWLILLTDSVKQKVTVRVA
jgi:hypothetical protein